MEIIPLTKNPDAHLEIHASINGVEGKFILDTGATGSLIYLEKLKMFGVDDLQDKIQGVRIGDEDNGKIDTFPIEVKRFSIGTRELKLKTIYANSAPTGSSSDIVGMIGHDALSELKGLLDLKALSLHIPEGEADLQTLLSDSSSSTYQSIELKQSDMGFSFVDIQLGKHQARLLVDSGAPQIVLDESVLTQQLGLKLENHLTAKTIVGEGVELPVKILKQEKITLGKITLTDDFLVSDFGALMSAINHQQQRLFVGVLGNKHMLEMNTIIDVANAKLYIKP